MKVKSGFTKIDCIVVLGCAVLLIANIGAVGNMGRDRAKDIVCMSNLSRWGQIMHLFANDHGGNFWDYECPEPELAPVTERLGGHYFLENTLDYWDGNFQLACCPMAVNSGGSYGSAFVAYEHSPSSSAGYGLSHVAQRLGIDTSSGIARGSYGANVWLRNPTEKQMNPSSWHYPSPPWVKTAPWRTPNIANAAEVPLIGDSIAAGANPGYFNEVPEYDGDIPSPMTFEVIGMSRFCINRHNEQVNMCFFDGSVRKVGLKELWDLPWHRGDWYIDADGNPDHTPKANIGGKDGWGDSDHWMHDMKEYSPWLE